MNKERYNRLMKSVVTKTNEMREMIQDLALLSMGTTNFDDSVADYIQMIEQKIDHTYFEIKDLKTLIERKLK
ncbi:MAG: hypothetical protein H9791_03370 [Candidatus Bacteroides intestinipullorum]|uniref:Uncharacterized protein n=1 Tax=Candidatus Bacteroides intestinipullorum TaxID=2838471 RepID=A0A9E2KEV9_9BACE|nr:hypothetical protein [Candidatus Bacteroides intestinipullorum]